MQRCGRRRGAYRPAALPPARQRRAATQAPRRACSERVLPHARVPLSARSMAARGEALGLERERRATRKAARDERAVESSRPFRWLVRAGFAARGITYGAIGILSLALAMRAGNAGVAPNQQGALALIDRAPLGKLALGVVSV